jgi:hypothetical protein
MDPSTREKINKEILYLNCDFEKMNFSSKKEKEKAMMKMFKKQTRKYVTESNVMSGVMVHAYNPSTQKAEAGGS